MLDQQVFKFVSFSLVAYKPNTGPRDEENYHKAKGDNRIGNKVNCFSPISLPDSTNLKLIPLVQNHMRDETNDLYCAFSAFAYTSMNPLYYPGKKRTKIKKTKTQKTKIEQFTNRFHNNVQYHNHFTQISTNFDLNGDPISEKLKLNIDGYADKIKRKHASEKNQIYFVTGGIGCGKTTLISNLLSRIANEQEQISQGTKKSPYPYECVLVSLEKLLNSDTLDDNPLEKIDNYFEDVVLPKILEEARIQTELEGEDLNTLISAAPHAKFIIFVDGLDNVYHQFCKLCFTSKGKDDPLEYARRYFPGVNDLISYFSSDSSALGRLNASIVFGLREETLDLLDHCHGFGAEHQTVAAKGNILKLNSPSASKICDIIKDRLSLSIGTAAASQMISELGQNSEIFKHIEHLSVHGTRHTIKMIQRFSWAFQSIEKFRLYFCNKFSLISMFISSGYEHYSQIKTGITNLFLVNSEYRKENNPKGADGERLFTEEEVADHAHTYWLKFLLLKYVSSKGGNLSYIKKIFSGPDKYEENIVNLALYSLTEVNHGRLIRPDFTFQDEGNPVGLGMRTTDRGKFLLENDFCFSFSYLAVCLEDPWMLIPNSMTEIFDNPAGYSFLSSGDRRNFKLRLFDFLMNKIPSVSSFLTVLEKSLIDEESQKYKLFNHLKTEFDFPNFEAIRQNARLELNEVIKHFFDGEEKTSLYRFVENCFSDESKQSLEDAMTFSVVDCY